MSTTDKTITQKMNELKELVSWFDSDEFQLERAIDKYKEAQALAETIEKDLSSLKNEIVVLKEKFDA